MVSGSQKQDECESSVGAVEVSWVWPHILQKLKLCTGLLEIQNMSIQMMTRRDEQLVPEFSKSRKKDEAKHVGLCSDIRSSGQSKLQIKPRSQV